MNDEIRYIAQLIIPVLNKYGIHSASIVGSLATGDFTDDSDIDLVVDIEKPMSLLTFSTLKLELEEILHKKVDLLERSAIKPRLKKSLLSNEIIIA